MQYKQTDYVEAWFYEEGDEQDSHLIGYISLYNFNIGSAVLARDHIAEIDYLASTAADNDYYFDITGNASRSGNRAFNQQLSLLRMGKVYDRFIAAGLSEERVMNISALGEDGWAGMGVKDGTENAHHRCVAITMWRSDPRMMTVAYRRMSVNRLKMTYTKTS